MSNEQKLLHVALEAINALMMGAERYSDNHWGRICMPTDSAMSKGADAAMAIRQALATTEPEPEPTGMPELPDADVSFEDGKDQYGYTEYGHAFSFQRTKAYGEQCWKAGYKHGAWADKPEPTSKQSLQVGPAVNKQLTTEPVDEREAFENDTKDAERYRWLASSESDAMNAKSKDHQWSVTDAWTTLQKPGADKALIDAAIDDAMAKGVKG